MIDPDNIQGLDDQQLELQLTGNNSILDLLLTFRDTSLYDWQSFYGFMLRGFDYADKNPAMQPAMFAMQHLFFRIRYSAPEGIQCEKVVTAMINTLAGFVKLLELEQESRHAGNESKAVEEDGPREHGGTPKRPLH